MKKKPNPIAKLLRIFKSQRIKARRGRASYTRKAKHKNEIST